MTMQNHEKQYNDYEIDLKLSFLRLWRAKLFILFVSFVFVLFASVRLQTSDRQYTITQKLTPVTQSEQQKSPFSQFGGLASLAGINVAPASDDFNIYKELMTSVEVSRFIIRNKDLIKEIYASEWDSSKNSFSKPPISNVKRHINKFKRLLTGNNEVIYQPPNARRLSMYIYKNLFVETDADTGFLTIQAETPKPDMMLSLIQEVTKATDNIMRQRYINFSLEPLDFYKEKLRVSRSREHREALAELIMIEEQKLMLASRGKYFTAEPFIDPVISLYPTSPKPKLALTVALIFGLFIGSGIVLVRHTLARDD
jgi:hypothetical protein